MPVYSITSTDDDAAAAAAAAPPPRRRATLQCVLAVGGASLAVLALAAAARGADGGDARLWAPVVAPKVLREVADGFPTDDTLSSGDEYWQATRAWKQKKLLALYLVSFDPRT